MHVTCSQAALATALRALSRMTRKELFPLSQSVLFTAHGPTLPSDQGGMLTLLGRGMNGTVGMLMHIPATVEQEGQVLVPMEPLSEYVGGLRPGDVTLQYAPAATLAEDEQQASSPSPGLHAPTTRFPLQIRSVYRSTAATLSTNQATVATWNNGEVYPLSLIQQWLTTRVPIAVLQASSFKEAIARCVPFANKGTPGKGEATELEGILVCLTHDAIAFSAATKTTLMNVHLPLHQPPAFSFTGLFLGKALSWVKESLAPGEVTLALARDEQTHTDMLLIATAQVTWFCCPMEVPPPDAWTRILTIPHATELLIERRGLIAPLKFFAGPVVETYQALSLVTQGNSLTLSMFGSDDTTVLHHQEIEVLRSSADLSILLDPRQFKALIRAASGDHLCLQIGHFSRPGKKQHPIRVDFLRIVSEQTIGIMSLSERLSPASLPAPEGGVAAGVDAKPPFALQGV